MRQENRRTTVWWALCATDPSKVAQQVVTRWSQNGVAGPQWDYGEVMRVLSSATGLLIVPPRISLQGFKGVLVSWHRSVNIHFQWGRAADTVNYEPLTRGRWLYWHSWIVHPSQFFGGEFCIMRNYSMEKLNRVCTIEVTTDVETSSRGNVKH